MKVTLLAYTPNPADVAEISAKTCYSEQGPSEIIPSVDKTALKRAIESGHCSVLEHVTFTFAVEGVSRSLTHQLVRHRVASYSQQSQRYVFLDDEQYVRPESILRDDGADAIYTECMETAWDTYRRLIEKGIPPEDARYVLPNACCTNIVVTMNARELLHFFSLRCCNRAQWEIRLLANSMLGICKEVAPEIFKDAGASCEQLGYCPEVKSCGKKKKLITILDGKKN